MISRYVLTNDYNGIFSDILKGSVGILNNYNLCHIKTIQWSEIITGPSSMYVYVYNFTEPERDCTPCHETCEVLHYLLRPLSIKKN